jgi:hypothetical protein
VGNRRPVAERRAPPASVNGAAPGPNESMIGMAYPFNILSLSISRR